MTITVDYSLHIVARMGKVAWSLGVDRGGDAVELVAEGVIGETTSGRREEAFGTASAAALSALEATDEWKHGCCADLHIFDSAWRKHMLDLGGDFGRLRVPERSLMRRDPTWGRPGFERCLDLLGISDFAADASTATKKRIIAATDGSYSPGRGGGASYGWVRNDGRFGMNSVDTQNIFVAELAAVHGLLREASESDHLTVLMDSTSAIDALNAVLAGTRHGGHIEKRIAHLVKSRHLDVEFEWVRGHNGHPLNDAADRLARLARQTRNTLSLADRAKIARNIVEETLTTFHAAA